MISPKTKLRCYLPDSTEVDEYKVTKKYLKDVANSEDGKIVLKMKCADVTLDSPLFQFHVDAIQRAVDFVENPENSAAGLAAPQIELPSSWFVMKRNRDKSILIVINPTILGKIGNKQYIEACFSEELPARVKRAKSITVAYTSMTLEGDGKYSLEEIKETLEGVDAQVFQHEYDHLQGVLICDRGEVIGKKENND